MRRAASGALMLAAVLGTSCGKVTTPTDCVARPQTRVLAASPEPGSILAKGTAVPVTALLHFNGCMNASVTMFFFDQDDRVISLGRGVQVPVGISSATLEGTIAVPDSGATTIVVHLNMLAGGRTSPSVAARWEYPVR
jgi:hypothetical protein